ncbi:MAG: hypothetical protein ACTSRI_20630 [Promethearchaeota archaeon]
MITIVALSWFHKKIGPIIAYDYPEGILNEKLSAKIANIMDQTVNEGFFTHSFEKYNSMNYYFEIHSDFARGGQEMLMISIIFNQQTNAEIEHDVKMLCIDFIENLQSNQDIFAAFYINELNYYDEEGIENIIKNDKIIKESVKDLYKAIIEDTREKSEEEKISILLNKKHIFLTLKKLSKGPITLEGLNEWFKENFPNKNFKKLIGTLADKQFIFVNQIGRVDKYILLVKEVNAERIPPETVIEYIDKTPELIELVLLKIKEYFSMHENKKEEELEKDSFILFQIMSDPKLYNILSELRNGLIPRDKLSELVSKRTLDSLNKNIDFLKKNDVIEEINYNNENYIVLKTNFQIITAFPKWMRKLLPKESKPVVANKYDPKTVKKQLGKRAENFKKGRNKEV